MTSNPNQHQKVADELERRLQAPTRDAAEGAGIKCPTCGDEVTDIVHALDCDRHLQAAPPKPAPDAVREALKDALGEIVLVIAFLERDGGTDRLPATIKSLVARLVKADRAIRETLAAPVPSPDGAGELPPTKSRSAPSEVVGANHAGPGREEETRPPSSPSPAVAAEPGAWRPGRSIEDRARDLLEVELSADPVQPTVAALRAIGAALRGESQVIAALLAVWDDWIIANDESGMEEYHIKDVAPETIQIVQRALHGRLYATPPVRGDRDTLYAILSKHIPQDMIDGIWQELVEAGQSGAGERDDSAQNCDCDPARVGCVCTCERSVHEDGT